MSYPHFGSISLKDDHPSPFVSRRQKLSIVIEFHRGDYVRCIGEQGGWRRGEGGGERGRTVKEVKHIEEARESGE